MAILSVPQSCQSGRLDLASQLGPIYPLDEINHAIDASLGGSPGRVLVRP